MADTKAFNIKIEGLDELVRDARRIGGDFPARLLGIMNKGTTMVQEEAKRINPSSFKNRTGNLRRSIFRRVQGPQKGVVGVPENYGAYVEFGTKPHVIRPKKGKFLAFKSGAGKTIFARSINHPGSKPYPFMEPAFRRSVNPIFDMYVQFGKDVVKAMEGKI